MPGFSTTLRATVAPKQRRMEERKEENGSNRLRKRGKPKKNQSASTSRLRPDEYHLLSYREKSGFDMFASTFVSSLRNQLRAFGGRVRLKHRAHHAAVVVHVFVGQAGVRQTRSVFTASIQ